MSTSSAWPDAITVTESPAGLAYRLPRRRPHRRLLRPVATHAAIGLALGAAGVAVWVFGSAQVVGLGVALIVQGLVFPAVGAALLVTRSSVALTTEGITFTEWVGPVPLARSRPLGHLRRFVTHRALEGDDVWPPPNGTLQVVCEGSQNLYFAVGYPYEWLRALAADLAARCGVPHEEAPLDGSPAVKVRPFFLEPVRDGDTFDRPDPPAGTRIAVERRPGGAAVLRVPPGRLLGGTAGLVLFIIVALGPVYVFLGAYVLTWPGPAYLALGLIGAALPAAAWHFHNRHTTLTVTPDALAVLETGGLLPPRERCWSRGELSAIRIGPGSSSGRGRPTWELYFYLSDGKSVGLFCGRDREELAWLATALRRELRLPAVAREGGETTP